MLFKILLSTLVHLSTLVLFTKDDELFSILIKETEVATTFDKFNFNDRCANLVKEINKC